MKKLLIVLLALTVIGIFAFAEDAMAAPAPAPIGTFTSWNTRTWSCIIQSTALPAHSLDRIGIPLPGIDQEREFAYHGKDYGFYADLEFGIDNFGNVVSGVGQGQGVAGENASINRFATWYDVAPGLVRVEIGKPRAGRAPGGFADGGSMGQFYLNSEFGADIQLLPHQGFFRDGFQHDSRGHRCHGLC